MCIKDQNGPTVKVVSNVKTSFFLADLLGNSMHVYKAHY